MAAFASCRQKGRRPRLRHALEPNPLADRRSRFRHRDAGRMRGYAGQHRPVPATRNRHCAIRRRRWRLCVYEGSAPEALGCAFAPRDRNRRAWLTGGEEYRPPRPESRRHRSTTRCPSCLADRGCERLRFDPALLCGCGSSGTHAQRRRRMLLHANAKLGLAGRVALVRAIERGKRGVEPARCHSRRRPASGGSRSRPAGYSSRGSRSCQCRSRAAFSPAWSRSPGSASTVPASDLARARARGRA